MQKPLISAPAEMGGFVLVEASAPNPGEQKSVLGNDAIGIGYAIKNRYRERKYFTEFFCEVERVALLRLFLFAA